jgi:hypothetical protein
MHPLFPVDTQELDARSTIRSTEEESVNCKKFLHSATLRIALMPARLVVSRRLRCYKIRIFPGIHLNRS